MSLPYKAIRRVEYRFDRATAEQGLPADAAARPQDCGYFDIQKLPESFPDLSKRRG